MPTYIYETVDEPHLRFEIKQSMKEEPLKCHPQTGAPVRRVISGGYGMIIKSAQAPCGEPKGFCGSACGCGCGHAH